MRPRYAVKDFGVVQNLRLAESCKVFTDVGAALNWLTLTVRSQFDAD
jgi:hypothetical protein